MKNKFIEEKNEEVNENKNKEIKLKSEMYNHDNELMEKRDDEHNDAVMWGFVIGFVLFFILLIMIIIFTN